MKSWLDHNAIQVKNLDIYIEFFKVVFGMPVEKSMGRAPERKVWLEGGIQLNENIDFKGPEGRQDHLGIMTDKKERVLDLAYENGAKELSQGHNWIEILDGLHIEVIGPND